MVTIDVGNYHQFPFRGWVRTTVDKLLPGAAFRVPVESASQDREALVVSAGQVTPSLAEVDVFLDLPGSFVGSIVLDRMQESTAERFVRRAIPGNVLEVLGVPMAFGVPMQFVSVEPSGAGYAVTLRARVGRMLVVEFDTVYYPGQPWLVGELSITASNPAVSDLTAEIPDGPLPLSFAGVPAIVVGGPDFKLLGRTLANGQSLVFPVAVAYPNAMRGDDWASATVACHNFVRVRGATSWPQGRPRMHTGFDFRRWPAVRAGLAIDALQTWAPVPGIGPNPRSGDTGAQGDQLFVGGECVGRDGLGAEWVRYLTACMQGRRPCNHREADGRLLDIDAHPQLRLWDGQVHWHEGVSPDRLGKPRPVNETETHGWLGPDVEHAYMDNLAVAFRLTGRRGVGRLLESLARVYLFQWTSAPGLSTSQAYAARAIGIEGLNAYLFWLCLRDRDLATRVRQRWLDRWGAIVSRATADDIWDVRIDDPRLGAGAWWMPWQQALGAYGLDLAGELFQVPEARAAALRAARRVVADGWKRNEAGAWETAPVRPVEGTVVWREGTDMATAERMTADDLVMARRYVHKDCGVPMPSALTDATAPLFDGSFNLFGMPLAPAVVLRHDPTHPTATSIYEQLLTESGGGSTWFPPEIVRG